MRRPSVLVASLAAASLVVAACSSGPGGSEGLEPVPTASPAAPGASAGRPSVLPVIVSSEQVVGTNRFVFSFLDAEANRPAAAPDRPASVAFIPPGSAEPTESVEGTFVWGIEDVAGVYVADVEFPVAGQWTARFTTSAPDGPEERIDFGFDVKEDGSAIAVGEPVPAVDTPTAADVGGDVAKLSTDPQPDPRFYETSVADALAAKEPFVLVFATPAFCQTAQCGPTLDRVKAVAAEVPDMTFINVEPYELQVTEAGLQPVLANGSLDPVEAVEAFGILTEPWVFVVDGQGAVHGSFEGIVSEEELRASIESLGG